jgi:hypothetical protein
VDAIETLVRNLPGEADQVRRLFWRDPEFRTVCEDYRDALEAMRRLEPPHPPDPARAEEYRELAAELLAEAAEMLRRSTGSWRRSCWRRRPRC